MLLEKKYAVHVQFVTDSDYGKVAFRRGMELGKTLHGKTMVEEWELTAASLNNLFISGGQLEFPRNRWPVYTFTFHTHTVHCTVYIQCICTPSQLALLTCDLKVH